MRLQLKRLEQLAPLSDEEVAERVVSGDSGAFELLMRRHNERLFRTARSVLSCDEDAQDALQEAYIRVYHGLPGFQERTALVVWMTRIVFNESIRFRTRRAGVRRFEQTGAPPCMFDQHADTREPLMDRTQRIDIFDQAMAALSENERAVVMLRVIHGLSTRETAASLGMTESNVKVCLFRARPKMAASLEGAGAQEICQQLSFDGERCDRLVAAVFLRLEAPANRGS